MYYRWIDTEMPAWAVTEIRVKEVAVRGIVSMRKSDARRRKLRRKQSKRKS